MMSVKPTIFSYHTFLHGDSLGPRYAFCSGVYLSKYLAQSNKIYKIIDRLGTVPVQVAA